MRDGCDAIGGEAPTLAATTDCATISENEASGAVLGGVAGAIVGNQFGLPTTSACKPAWWANTAFSGSQMGREQAETIRRARGASRPERAIGHRSPLPRAGGRASDGAPEGAAARWPRPSPGPRSTQSRTNSAFGRTASTWARSGPLEDRFAPLPDAGNTTSAVSAPTAALWREPDSAGAQTGP